MKKIVIASLLFLLVVALIAADYFAISKYSDLKNKEEVKLHTASCVASVK
jgi:hypothetical protein